MNSIDQITKAHTNCIADIKEATAMLNDLLSEDNGELSVDPEVISRRRQEEVLLERIKGLYVQEDLLSKIILGWHEKASVTVPEVADKYISAHKKSHPYKGQPGLIIQDTFISMGDDDLEDMGPEL